MNPFGRRAMANVEVQRQVMRENHTRTISLQQPGQPQFDHPRSQQFLS